MKYKIITCSGCNGLSHPHYPKCKDPARCPSPVKIYPVEDTELLIFKNDTFDKYYFVRDNTFHISPFFVDCLLHRVQGKKLTEYPLRDGKVTMRKKADSLQYLYELSVPKYGERFDDLHELYADYLGNRLDQKDLDIWIRQQGILYYLLGDPKIQEINVNPPEFQTPFSVYHEDYGECTTNVYPSIDFLNHLSTFLKTASGRPLNKAQPQLDGELRVGKIKARVAAVVPPFSIHGIGYSIRKHRERPWTSLLFIQKKAYDTFFAGFLSFLIAHGRTYMVAGPRGSGKTSILGSTLLEIPSKYRVITIEDTQELPVDALKQEGYDLLALNVRSALLKHGLEIPFEQGLRTSLRLGDSCLILGEIRSTEAVVLYEAMRVGAMSNVVAATIHADSPYGVYDRVVNDLGVPRGSFKATDLLIILGQIKSATGVGRERRVIRVAEVLKDWSDEPVFQDLFVYNPKKDELEPTRELANGKSVILKDILSRARGFKDYNDILIDIDLRAWAKQEAIDVFSHFPSGLEAPTVVALNNQFNIHYEEFDPLKSEKKEAQFKKAMRAWMDGYAKQLGLVLPAGGEGRSK